MNKHFVLYSLCAALMIIMWSGLNVQAASPAHPCIDCHSTETPRIVEQWKKSRHSMNDVDCQVCHLAGVGDPSAIDHNGFSITKNLTLAYCEGCHALADEIMKESRDKNGTFSHAPLK